MRKWVVAIMFGAALILGACGDGEQAEVAPGEEIYKKNCASCHGQDLSGGAGPALESVGSQFSVDDIVDIIENGKGDMRPQKQVAEEDRVIVAEWLINEQ